MEYETSSKNLTWKHRTIQTRLLDMVIEQVDQLALLAEIKRFVLMFLLLWVDTVIGEKIMFLYPMSIKLIIQNVIECLTTIKKTR